MPKQAQRGGGGILPAHSQPGTRRRWLISKTFRLIYHSESPSTQYTEGWAGPRARLDGTENLANTGIRFPDSPACSESLYQLSYPSR